MPTAARCVLRAAANPRTNPTTGRGKTPSRRRTPASVSPVGQLDSQQHATTAAVATTSARTGDASGVAPGGLPIPVASPQPVFDTFLTYPI